MAEPPFDARSELEFVRKVIARDSTAIDSFVHRMRCVPRFLGVLNLDSRRLGAHTLEDLAQRVLTIVLEKLPEFRALAPLEIWVRRVCENEFHNERRRQDRRQREVSADPDRFAEPAVEPSVDVERVRVCIDRLGGYEAEIVRARHLSGLSFEDIAANLGVSAPKVKAIYYRSIGRLQRCLEGSEGGQLS